MSGQIFISYRREESRWSARSLRDRLSASFDPNQIFMDIDAIALGEDFVKAIETTVAKCDVLIALIGNNWLTSKDDQGSRRLDNPEDFVRMEIATALKREIRVIPVLVDGALMPRSPELPDDLKSLVRRNALRITDTSFDGDCQRLAAAISLVLEKAATEEQEREKNRLDPESRAREGSDKDKNVPPTPALSQDRGPAQAAIAPVMQSQRSAMRKPFTLRAPIVIIALLLIIGVIWLAGSKLNHTDRETALVTPTASTPTPTATATATGTPTPGVPSSNSDFYTNRGWDFYQKKEYDKAISDYNEAIRLDPNNAWPYNRRGIAHDDKKEYDLAISDYSEAIRLSPSYVEAYSNRGNAYNDKGEYDKAISDYNDAIRLNPNYAIAYNNRGSTYDDKNEYDKAISDYNEAIRLDPNYANAYNNRGVAYYHKSEYDKAISDYSEAIRLDPNYANAYYNRGLAHAANKEYDKAISDYNEAIRLNPNYAKAYYSRGLADRAQGNHEQAQTDFATAKLLGYAPSNQ